MNLIYSFLPLLIWVAIPVIIIVIFSSKIRNLSRAIEALRREVYELHAYIAAQAPQTPPSYQQPPQYSQSPQ
jgi:hypothetical protein